jgi:hypothetical protein
MTYRLGLVAGLAGMLSAASFGAEAATRALVVGVSGYPNLQSSLHLVGPKNDSREFSNTIHRLGLPADGITVLADGISGLADGLSAKGPGTKEAILAELDRLAEESQPGDLVVFYFSGHGSQQPDRNGDEQGGNDEIFLPYDVGKYEDGSVKNALVDDELNERIVKILEKGADFFGVIDACHSATGFRAFDEDDARVRQVDPAELGVPAMEDSGNRAAFAAIEEAPRSAFRGRAAFFYAAQEIEVAREQKPKNGDTDEYFGVFTYNLLKRLSVSPNLTYRSLHQAVVDDIKRGNLMSSQTPELEGELLDEPFLRLSSAPQRRQWPIAVGRLQAGELAGVTAGTILALYDDPAAPDDMPVAHGVVVTAGATKSVVEPIPFPCLEFDEEGNCLTAPPEPDIVKKGRFARVIEPGIDFSLVLSEPIRLDANDGFDYTAAVAALRDAVGSEPLAPRVSLRSSGYDLAVGLVDGKLAFAPAAGLIDAAGPGTSPRLTLPDNPDAAKAAAVAAVSRMAKALALQRMGSASDLKGLGLTAKLRVQRSLDGVATDGACPDMAYGYEDAAPAGETPSFKPCDIIQISMINTGKKPMDVTVLLVGQDFSITPVWPVDGESNRIHLGESKTADILQVDPATATASEERLVFVAVPGVSKTHTAFDNLEQEGVRAFPAGDETPEAAAARDLLTASVARMKQTSAAQPPRLEEEMSIDVRPFFVRQGGDR